VETKCETGKTTAAQKACLNGWRCSSLGVQDPFVKLNLQHPASNLLFHLVGPGLGPSWEGFGSTFSSPRKHPTRQPEAQQQQTSLGLEILLEQLEWPKLPPTQMGRPSMLPMPRGKTLFCIGQLDCSPQFWKGAPEPFIFGIFLALCSTAGDFPRMPPRPISINALVADSSCRSE